jgi:hypothetical protein
LLHIRIYNDFYGFILTSGKESSSQPQDEHPGQDNCFDLTSLTENPNPLEVLE